MSASAARQRIQASREAWARIIDRIFCALLYTVAGIRSAVISCTLMLGWKSSALSRIHCGFRPARSTALMVRLATPASGASGQRHLLDFRSQLDEHFSCGRDRVKRFRCGGR